MTVKRHVIPRAVADSTSAMVFPAGGATRPGIAAKALLHALRRPTGRPPSYSRPSPARDQNDDGWEAA